MFSSSRRVRASVVRKSMHSLFLLSLVVILPPIDLAASTLKITVDASEIQRKLIYSTIELDSSCDTLVLLYPKWIPGCHGPTGPVDNVAGLRVSDPSGSPLRWVRDWSDPFRFFVFDAGKERRATVNLTYVCSQPTANSWGGDCDGLSTLGVINWNAVTVYPEGEAIADIRVQARLLLPDGWRFATALPTKETCGDTVIFQEVSYEELLDDPLICGVYLNTYAIATTPSAKYFIHVAVDDETLLTHADSAFADSFSVDWSSLCKEAEALFSRAHFDSYHFLVVVSDSVSHYGLEHRNSSVNSARLTTLTEYGESDFWLQYVMPHEFSHAWCGKYRRPQGMTASDYQTPLQMELLWVYEGLDQYLGHVLGLRSGIERLDFFKANEVFWWGQLRNTVGRNWRSLEDVAVSNYAMGTGESWYFLRRGWDYYGEAALVWMEIDCRLREMSNGKVSFDDFCRTFFANGDPATHSVPFERGEIVSVLNGLATFNWDSLLTVRMAGVSEKLDETPLHLAGYRFGYASVKPKPLSDMESIDKMRYYDASLGFRLLDDKATIGQIIPTSPADKAGLVTGMSILGVNGRTYSIERLEKAIRDAVTAGEIRLLVQHGETLQEKTLTYRDGPRYLTLEPVEGKRKWLDEIAKPLVTK